MVYEATRNWNEPQGSPSAWVIAINGTCDYDYEYSSKARCLSAIKVLKQKKQPK
jgi:hypothetical protein